MLIAHASIVGISQFVSERYAGFNFYKEMQFLQTAIASPERPVAAVIGGLKVSTKTDILTYLLDRVDKLLIGGAMVFTFYKALGHNVGDSFVEESSIATAQEIIQKAAYKEIVLKFASDCTVIPTRAFNMKLAKRKAHTTENIIHPEMEYCMRNVTFDSIPEHWTGVDIGPQTLADFGLELGGCRTIIMNGKSVLFYIYDNVFIYKSNIVLV
jgi:phosphoglycerate kinase